MRHLRRIAIEEAFWLDSLSTQQLADGATASPYKAQYRSKWARRLVDFTEYRIPEMDAHGIDLQILSLATPGVQMQPDTDVAIDDARRANDALAAIVKEHTPRFAGLAALPLQSPEAAARELRRAVTELGLHGALVNDHTLGHYLDERRFDVVWAELQDLGVPLYLHPTNVLPAPWPLLDGRPELDGPTFTFTVATAGHALRLIYGGVFERFPDTTVILGHMGEFLPFWFARLDAAHQRLDPQEHLTKLPSQYFTDNFVITTSGVTSHAALQAAIQTVGIDNILFAVDYPFESTAEAVAFLDTAPLADADRKKIASRNAERLLRLTGFSA
ncbi:MULTISPECIES: amidohydrolase family protein [Streptomyces]|uniref:amidohydrolase family protein n=1 Tax=Streptomyces lycopersici TaxID=2974589 RepID=UPI0021CF77EA|nr:amidohydrolase family protein [Streptomyces sp. NEAU-383]